MAESWHFLTFLTCGPSPPSVFQLFIPSSRACGLSCLASINNKVEGVIQALLKGLVAANMRWCLVDFPPFNQPAVVLVTHFIQ